MPKRKSVNLSIPSTVGVYRPTTPDTLEITQGRPNPAFTLDPEALDSAARGSGSGGSVPNSGTNDRSSNSTAIFFINEVPDIKAEGPGEATPNRQGSSSDAGGREVTEVDNTVIEQQQPQLKKSINLLHCMAIMVAVTGHSSIFISPASILGVTGSIGASLIVWLIGGLINMGLALCFMELGTMLPKAGGNYVYVLETFGPLPGFLILWGIVVLIVGPAWAFLAYTAALYIIKPFFPDCHPGDVDTGIKVLAGWIMITLVALNCVYMKYVTKIQTFVSSTKIIALLIIIGGGIYHLAIGNTENFQSVFEGTSQEPGQWAVAIFYSIFSYGGWQSIVYMAEELKSPGRDLPISVYLTFTIVTASFIMAKVAYFTLITPADMLHTNAVALLFVQRLYRPLSAVMAVLVASTSIGALNACIMGNSRLLFAGARNGHMPVILGMIHQKYLTPWPAILVLLVWGLAMLYSGNVTDMMEFISLFSTISSISVICSLLYLRYTKPNEHRPYKTMLFVPVVQLLINVAVLILAVYQKPHRMGVGLAIVFAGIPVYWLGVLWRSKPPEFTHLVEGLTVFAQKLFLHVKSQ